MPIGSGTPDLVRHCVAAVAKQYGGDVDKAFAICVAQLQKAGYLKPGTMELTAAGRKKEKEHEMETDAKKKLAAYEKLLKGAKEARKEESYDDLDRLLNPRTRTGLEDAPRTISRKYESVSRGESSMDFVRRLAGISPRYTDRTASVTEASKGLKWERSEWFDDEFMFADEMEQAESPSGKFTAIVVKPKGKKSDWAVYKTASMHRGGWNPVMMLPAGGSTIVRGVEDKRGYASYEAAKKDAEAALLRLDGDKSESRVVAEGLELKLTQVLNDAGFDSHDFHFEDGLIASDMKTGLKMVLAIAKAGMIRGDVSLNPQGQSKGQVKISFQ